MIPERVFKRCLDKSVLNFLLLRSNYKQGSMRNNILIFVLILFTAYYLIHRITNFFFTSHLTWRLSFKLSTNIYEWTPNNYTNSYCVWYDFTKAASWASDNYVSLCTHGLIGDAEMLFNQV